ncbi:MAG: DUF1697 domain-containing protein [Clostridia bacterium]|nr:DUF1697 domain-containing protein [Clostridia bacterium]
MRLRYIVLLRGVNISGKNKLAMTDFAAALSSLGFTGVKTLLNSGNAAFTAEEAPPQALAETIRAALSLRCGLDVPVLVTARDTLVSLLSEAPAWWGSEDKALYDNLIFPLPPTTGPELAGLLGAPSETLEQVSVRDTAIYWTFDRAKYQKAAWWKKTATAGLTEKVTIRTAGTVKKLASF